MSCLYCNIHPKCELRKKVHLFIIFQNHIDYFTGAQAASFFFFLFLNWSNRCFECCRSDHLNYVFVLALIFSLDESGHCKTLR